MFSRLLHKSNRDPNILHTCWYWDLRNQWYRYQYINSFMDSNNTGCHILNSSILYRKHNLVNRLYISNLSSRHSKIQDNNIHMNRSLNLDSIRNILPNIWYIYRKFYINHIHTDNHHIRYFHQFM